MVTMLCDAMPCAFVGDQTGASHDNLAGGDVGGASGGLCRSGNQHAWELEAALEVVGKLDVRRAEKENLRCQAIKSFFECAGVPRCHIAVLHEQLLADVACIAGGGVSAAKIQVFLQSRGYTNLKLIPT